MDKLCLNPPIAHALYIVYIIHIHGKLISLTDKRIDRLSEIFKHPLLLINQYHDKIYLKQLYLAYTKSIFTFFTWSTIFSINHFSYIAASLVYYW